MKDERGLYYHPAPQFKSRRMYVREDASGGIEFRLWSGEDPQVWETHPWIPRTVIEVAVRLGQAEGRDMHGQNPLDLYDLAVARRLLDDDRRD
jgi:hypothetical protein